MKNQLTELSIFTPDGEFGARYSEKGLVEVEFPNQRRAGKKTESANVSKQICNWHRLTAAGLKSILAGHDAKKLPPMDWAGKTDFQKSVWRVLLKIAAGKTKSYGEVAVAIGKPKAVRAVGGACGANPIPVLIPCHRVLAANKKLGGFTSGLDWKRDLLAREGVKI